MKRISLTITLLTCFAMNLLAVPAVPFLITFSQPDGSTFQAHLRGDEYFSWIEIENKQVLVKSKSSGYFEFALLKRDDKNRLKRLCLQVLPVYKTGSIQHYGPTPISQIFHVNSWAKYGKAELRQKEILNYFHPVTNFVFALQFNLWIVVLLLLLS